MSPAQAWRDGRIPIGSEENIWPRVGVWILVVLVGSSLMLSTRFLWASAAAKAAGEIHKKVFAKILGCPTGFLDRTPSGRIMNRLGEDQMAIDFTLTIFLEVALLVGFQSLNIMVLVCHPHQNTLN